MGTSDNHEGASPPLVPDQLLHRVSSALVLPEICMEMPPPRIVREHLSRSEVVTIASAQFGEIMETSARGHADLAAGRWKSLSLIEQLANVGSELERPIRAHEAGRAERRESAVNRCLELFDLTAADGRWHGPPAPRDSKGKRGTLHTLLG